LITQDKQEIVDKAKEIGTYDTSILPYGDCCSYMIAKHPVLDPKKNVVEKLEEQLPIKNLVLNAVKNAEIVRY
jgi:tRNA uracil 4-sulfurtransferase